MKDKIKIQDKKAELVFFNNFEIDGYDVFDNRGYNRILFYLEKLVQPRRGERVIEFGCGTGGFTKHLGKFGLNVKGVDISFKCIRYAKERYPNIIFFVTDIENAGLRDGVFDIVILGGVLHHLEDLLRCAKEVYRVLKQGGRFFAYDPHRISPMMWLYRDKKSLFYSNVGVTSNERLLTAEEIKKVFTDIGFKEILVFPTSGITYRHVEGGIAKILLLLYNLFETIWGKTYFSRKYGSFLISYGGKHNGYNLV